jgi:hypothetical protein
MVDVVKVVWVWVVLRRRVLVSSRVVVWSMVWVNNSVVVPFGKNVVEKVAVVVRAGKAKYVALDPNTRPTARSALAIVAALTKDACLAFRATESSNQTCRFPPWRRSRVFDSY